MAAIELYPVSTLRQLVQLEAIAVPSRVAAPFDILTISSAGPEWNEHGECK
jgi:hypothetical protein